MKTWEKVQEASRANREHAAGEKRDFERSVFDHVSLCGKKRKGERTWFRPENQRSRVDCQACLAKMAERI